MLNDLYPLLWVAWQPIMDLHSGTPWGYEATVRGPEGAQQGSFDALLELAQEENLVQEFAEFCRDLVFRAAATELPRSAMLVLTADPRIAGMPLIPEDVDWPVTRTVIEISEGSPLFERPESLAAEVLALHRQGYRIAFAGFGSGFAGPMAMLSAHPDIVKIDRHLVHEIDRDPWRQEMVSSIVRAASDMGVAVVADGIETVTELADLVARHITLGQGTLLGRAAPGAQMAEFSESHLESRLETSKMLSTKLPSSGAAYVVDSARRIVAWNQDAVALAGYGPQAVIGTTCWLSGLDHHDAKGSHLCFRACPLVRAMRTGQPQRGTVSLRTAGGARKWVQIRATPVRDETGEVVGAVETFTRTRKPDAQGA